MNLLQKITADMKEAMKSKNNATLSTLRLLLSALKYKQIDVQHDLSDQEVQSVIKTQVKQLKDSIVSYEQGSRADLVQATLLEVTILETYLPTELDDAVLESIVKEAVTHSGAKGKQDTGKAMGAAMKAVAGKADGSRVKQIVERLLSVFALVAIGLSVSLPARAALDFFASDNIFQTGVAAPSDVIIGLKVVRVLLLWIGLFAINTILIGSFAFMVASGRDDDQKKAMGQITSGFVGSVVIALLFVVSTVYIDLL